MKQNRAEELVQGKVYYLTKEADKEGLAWNDHPAFTGVSLKHLVRGEDTGGQFSAHLVRVRAGCEIGDHIHEGKWEMHEVIAGCGSCRLADRELPYQPGASAVLPPDVNHRVHAVEELYILAKFVPALV